MEPLRILVPRWLDAQNVNPQNLNATAMLSRFRSPEARWRGFYYHEPAREALGNPNVTLVKLWQTGLWKAKAFIEYQGSADAIFYPGTEAEDLQALVFRDRMYRHTPTIATLEALPGDEKREALYSEIAGHTVRCARVRDKALSRIDAILRKADLIIAISPFLATLGREVYGNKFRVQMLGVDEQFSPTKAKRPNARPKIINVASFQERKRPEMFFELAARFPQADFAWYGSGTRLEEMRQAAKSRNLTNLNFPGGASRQDLPEIMRQADIFVIPSDSEGVPKVTQEAAACGLPVVGFGFYEAPTVLHQHNGFVVWTDDEMFGAVELLLKDEALREEMGARGATMAAAWTWERRAPEWEREILGFLGR